MNRDKGILSKWISLILLIVTLCAGIHYEEIKADTVLSNDFFSYSQLTCNKDRKDLSCYLSTTSLNFQDNQCTEEVFGIRISRMSAQGNTHRSENSARKIDLAHCFQTEQADNSLFALRLLSSVDHSYVQRRKAIMSYIHSQDGEKG